MIKPIHVSVDLEVRAAYVKYGKGPSVETVDLNETGSVAYDKNAAGQIIGIEVLGVEHPEQIAIAQQFAAAHALAFPRDLAGALVPAA